MIWTEGKALFFDSRYKPKLVVAHVAKEAGVTHGLVSNLLAGKRTGPCTRVMRCITAAINARRADLGLSTITLEQFYEACDTHLYPQVSDMAEPVSTPPKE